MSTLDDLQREVRANDASSDGAFPAASYGAMLKQSLAPAVGAKGRVVSVVPVQVSVDSENRPTPYPGKTVSTEDGLAAFLSDRLVVCWSREGERNVFTTHAISYDDLKKVTSTTFERDGQEAVGITIRDRITWTMLFSTTVDADVVADFHEKAVDLLETALEARRMKAEPSSTTSPQKSTPRSSVSRRNLVLTVSTVAIMAVIAALLVWKPFGGGADDSLPGVTVSEGDVPEITVEEPLEVEEPETAVLSEGDGPEIDAKDYFRADYIIADGETGETVDSSFGEGANGAPAAAIVFQNVEASEAESPQTAPGLPEPMISALEGTKVGSKVLVGITAGDFFGDAAAQVGYEPGQTLIFYFDITDSIDVSADVTAPEGDEEELPAGIPTPVVDGDSVTGVDGAAATGPAALGVFTVVKGDGAEVEADDFVYANYVGQIYPSGAVFDSSFERESPSLFPLSGVIPCWTGQLPGQTIGSRVVLTCPSDSAYGDGGGAGGLIAPGDSLTFVIDIVDTV
ncbi:FKBP-type peptidyl-prolyl cis-trans isomerase [Aeromicrobium sp. Leaf350]|uniref:FKBP-type peptidyl-prolyl cis-trans isomerase n=1 Tax=Aeromicrobium sp. Leaf350 TaxID=2876565 RepID=UPI001E32D7F5|nr:FKBP-type peptidyl-prolyl cis-trans isomerase [Aeromicrobium sp. Leaf350]